MRLNRVFRTCSGVAGKHGDDVIYHLTTEEEFRGHCSNGLYRPSSLADEGFVHCADEPVVLAVANDYFAEIRERVLLLRIDPAALTASTVYENAAPIAGGGTVHLEMAKRFPHVYGPIEVSAVVAVGVLERTEHGYAWPIRMVDPDAFLPVE